MVRKRTVEAKVFTPHVERVGVSCDSRYEGDGDGHTSDF